MRRFLYGVVVGFILFPALYVGWLWLRHRSDTIDFDESEWP